MYFGGSMEVLLPPKYARPNSFRRLWSDRRFHGEACASQKKRKKAKAQAENALLKRIA
eukprot:IDg5828t1